MAESQTHQEIHFPLQGSDWNCACHLWAARGGYVEQRLGPLPSMVDTLQVSFLRASTLLNPK